MISGFNELLAGCAVVLYRRHSLFVCDVVLTTASNVHSSPHLLLLLLLLLFQVLLLLLLLILFTVLIILTVCNCVCWDVNSVVVVVVHVIISDVSGCVWMYIYIHIWLMFHKLSVRKWCHSVNFYNMEKCKLYFLWKCAPWVRKGKQSTLLLLITFPYYVNNRFSKFFHCSTTRH